MDRLSSALAGRYAVERELGAGGMATVYLAQDLRHDRQVAIKVLRPELAAVLGAERFVQEIKTTAQLQHPNILPLFDSGEADGFLYYVMPYIQGETLRTRLDRESQLGVDEAVKITTEVAGALDYAHRQGVIHRDIKPENILLHDGRPLVADFGIALAVSAAAGGRMTETGLSLGTPHYMSPEQATAEKDITAKSDVYSLGSVLYEMLTGDPPHTGSSAQQIIMKIVTDIPRPVAELRKSVPPNVAAALGKALEKLPADRFESAKAFGDALANVGFSTMTAPAGVRAAARATARLPWLVAGVSLAAALVLAILWRSAPSGAPAVAWVTDLDTPDSAGFGGGLAIAPDGSFVLYGNNGIWMRRADAVIPTRIAGTEGGCCPALSPDGQRVAFVRRGEVRVVPLAGGTSTLAGSVGGGDDDIAWLNDGAIVSAGLGGRGLVRVSPDGGPAEPFTVPDTAAGEAEHWSPRALPDGRGVVFTIVPPRAQVEAGLRIGVVGPEGGAHTVLMPGRVAAWAPPGHLLLTRADGAIVAVPFDLATLRITGEPVRVISVPGDPGTFTWRGYFAVARSGVLVYVSGWNREADLVWRTTAGRVSVVDSSLGTGWSVAAVVAPNGHTVAYVQWQESGRTIEVRDLLTGARSRITDDSGVVSQPAFSADGRSIFYRVHGGGRDGLYRAALGRLGEGVPVARLSSFDRVELAPDGRSLYYSRRAGRSVEIVRRSIGGAETVEEVVVSGIAGDFRVSPDGRWIALVSEEQGVPQLFLRSSDPARTERWTVFRGPDCCVAGWATNGRALYFLGSQAMRVARLSTGAAPAVERVDSLFDVQGYLPYFALAPDGRFLMTRPLSAPGSVRLRLVSDWRALLRRP